MSIVEDVPLSHTFVSRRNWFLERVLKLGLTMVAKEYQCASRELKFVMKASVFTLLLI